MLTWEEDVEASALRKQGWTISAIARHLGRDRKTIRAYVTDKQAPGKRALQAVAKCGLGPGVPKPMRVCNRNTGAFFQTTKDRLVTIVAKPTAFGGHEQLDRVGLRSNAKIRSDQDQGSLTYSDMPRLAGFA